MKKNKKKSVKQAKNKISVNSFITIAAIVLVIVAFASFMLKTSDNHILTHCLK